LKYPAVIAIVWVLATWVSGCRYFSLKSDDDSGEKVVARVGSEKLYLSALPLPLEPGMSKQDSMLIINNFIDSWALNRILLQKALMNLPDDKKEAFEKLVEEYRTDLYINYYKQALISQYFDTLFSPDEIKEYYEANKPLFKSDKVYVQYRMVVFDPSKVKKTGVEKRFEKMSEEDLDYFMENAIKFKALQLNDSTWTAWDGLIEKYPALSNLSLEKSLHKIQSITRNGTRYLIKLNGIIPIGGIKPLELAEEEIKKMMIHRKKIDFIKQTQTRLIQEAIQNNMYEKYE